jgi:RNA polymerase sigma-70 factor, ECF subfamily
VRSALAEQGAGGDPVQELSERFRAIYREHFPFVWRCMRRFGVHPASLDDATQDVFVVVHRRLGEFEGRSTVRTWLFGIALRVAKHHTRTQSQRGLQVTLDLELPDAEQLSPDEIAQRRNAARLLDAALYAMDEQLRIIFVLSELEDFTAKEIAEALNMNANTVSTRLRKARKELEKSIERMRAHEKWSSGT